MPQNGTKPDAQGEMQAFSRAWYDKMVQIWTDRIKLHGIYDTGALLHSVHGAGLAMGDMSLTAEFRFLAYGIYVDAGTGNGYRRGNGGDLEFLGKAYRYEHGLGEPRKPRPWFSRSWAISCRVIADQMQKFAGDRFVALFDNLAD